MWTNQEKNMPGVTIYLQFFLYTEKLFGPYNFTMCQVSVMKNTATYGRNRMVELNYYMNVSYSLDRQTD